MCALADRRELTVNKAHDLKDTSNLHPSSAVSLLNISESQLVALHAVGIHTVRALAESRIFLAARDAAQAYYAGRTDEDTAENEGSDGNESEPMAPPESSPSEAIVVAESDEPEKVSPVETLRDDLHMRMVRDLANWPPYLEARAIMETHAKAFVAEEDPDAPGDLLPKTGQYATETLRYRRAFIDQVIGTDAMNAPDLAEAGQISLDASGSRDIGFSKPAEGAVIDFEQSWRPKGLSLGQLLHSVGLAPGESTNVAVIDWRRTDRASLEESVSQEDAVSATTTQRRSISDVQYAVATESQSGRSEIDSYARTKSSAGGGGGTLNLGIASFGGGGSSASSTTEGEVVTVSSSMGRRAIGASELQKINASTMAASTAVRNKRASVVKEVEQRENETITTRNITNYNHSHALSVHYYEVVQIYDCETHQRDATRCLFVPLKLFDFENRDLISRYRSVLFSSALNDYTLDLLKRMTDQVKINFLMDFKVTSVGSKQWVPRDTLLTELFVSANGFDYDIEAVSSIEIFTRGSRNPVRPKSGRTQQEGKDVPDGRYILEEPIPFSDLFRIDALTGKHDERVLLSLNLKSLDGTILSASVRTTTFESHRRQLLSFSTSISDDQLSDILNEEALHYSRAIWSQMSAAHWAALLGSVCYKGRLLAEQIDFQPVTTFGNYVCFPWHTPPFDFSSVEELLDVERSVAERKFVFKPEVDGNQIEMYSRFEEFWRWESWKRLNLNGDASKSIEVPLPTEGVFAEAVLGRYNASEKLDITRFWDWQESPIPHQPPAIAPVNAGSRAIADGTTSPTLAPSSAALLQPQALPDPTGLTSLLTAVATNNMFRDMSGRDASAGALQTALEASNEGAAQAGSLAAQNMSRMVDLEQEKVRAARDVMMAYMGAKGGGGGKSSNSRTGALINQGKKIDKLKDRGSSGPTSGGVPSSGGTPNSGRANQGKTQGGAAGPPGSTPISREEEAFRVAANPIGSAVEAAYQNGSNSLPEGAVAGPGGIPVGGGYPIAASDPLDAEVILSHPDLVSIRQMTEEQIKTRFPNTKPDNPIGEEERKRAIIRNYIFQAEWIEASNTTIFLEGTNKRVKLLTYLIYDFPVGESAIQLDDVKHLKNLLERRGRALRDNNVELRLQISGTADSTGPTTINKELALARAERVARLLSSQHYRVSYKASDSPVIPDGDGLEVGRSLNRSVTIQESTVKLPSQLHPRLDEQIPEILKLARAKLETQKAGNPDADIGLTILDLYEEGLGPYKRGGNLEIASAERVTEYHSVYAVRLANKKTSPWYSSNGMPVYRADTFFTDVRPLIDRVLHYASSLALLHDDDASADTVVDIVIVNARHLWEGFKRHRMFNDANADNSGSAWKVMENEFYARANNSNSIYYVAFEKYKGLIQ